MLVATLLVLVTTVSGDAGFHFIVPKDFMFGAATSAFQAEGSWNIDGRGVSVWDTFMQKYSYLVSDHSNGERAADSYCRYKEDIKALKDMGMQFYRFSISWSRILPTGFANNVNQRGIDYYNELIDETIRNGIIPMVTMHHWDLPQIIQDLGGWTNGLIVDYFEDYARILFKAFGDRVKWWITINEPLALASAYEGDNALVHYAPFVNGTGIAPYLVGHNILKAHARIYHVYMDEFRNIQAGNLSMSIDIPWFEPENSYSVGDKQATERAADFLGNWFAHPIFSKTGDYPDIMKQRISNLSMASGFSKSRLPSFSTKEIEYIKGTAHFAALNLYSTHRVNDKQSGPDPSSNRDIGISYTLSSNFSNDHSEVFQEITPKGYRKAVNMFKHNYGDWDVFITECGYGDAGGINDTLRMKHLGVSMVEILKMIHEDNVKVIGFIVWSLIDLLEWSHGYTVKFGLYQVNFSNPTRPRIPKNSARLMKNIIAERRIPYRYMEEDLKLMNPYRLPNYSAGLPPKNQSSGPHIQLPCPPRVPPPTKPLPFMLQVFKTLSKLFATLGSIKSNIKKAIKNFFHIH